MKQNRKTNTELSGRYALYLSHKYTRAVINTSFIILFFILLLFGGKNPAAIFALVFYNGLHLSLLKNYQSKKSYQDITCSVPEELVDLLPSKISGAELAANQISLPVAVLLHLLLAFGFLYRMPLNITHMEKFPLIMLSLILITRYLSYLILKRYLTKKLH